MKEKLTEASIRLFEKKGFSETSIQDIVDSLGVTKGTFYYYFSSKEALLMDIHSGYIDHLLQQQVIVMNDQAKNCHEQLFAIVLMLLTIRQAGASAKIFFREISNLNEERLAMILPKRDKFRLNIEKVVRDGMAKGEFRPDLDPAIVTFGILGAANWSYQWFSPEGRLSEKEVSEIFIEMMLNGIRSH